MFRLLLRDPFGIGLVAALLAALLTPPLVPYELVGWEIAASLGYAACVALLLTFRAAPILPGSMTPHRFTLHRVAGHAAGVLVVGHVAVMLALDPLLVDYLGWLMPAHVLFGVLAGAGLLLATTREPALPSALRVGGGSRRWLHVWLGTAAMAFTVAHVLASGKKLIGVWRPALLGAALLLVLLPPLWRIAGGGVRSPPTDHAGVSRTRAAAAGLLTLLGILAVLLAAAPLLLLVARG
jgi:hypothetical protein